MALHCTALHKICVQHSHTQQLFLTDQAPQEHAGWTAAHCLQGCLHQRKHGTASKPEDTWYTKIHTQGRAVLLHCPLHPLLCYERRYGFTYAGDNETCVLNSLPNRMVPRNSPILVLMARRRQPESMQPILRPWRASPACRQPNLELP